MGRKSEMWRVAPSHPASSAPFDKVALMPMILIGHRHTYRKTTAATRVFRERDVTSSVAVDRGKSEDRYVRTTSISDYTCLSKRLSIPGTRICERGPIIRDWIK